VRYRYRYRDQIFEITLERSGEGYRATVDGVVYELEMLNNQPGQLSLRFDGRPVNLYWAADEETKWVSLFGCTYPLEKPVVGRAHPAGEGAAESLVRSPMPAQVRSLEVAVGDQVERGDTLLLLEAMKMEIRVRAPVAGRIAAIPVSAGQTVNRDQVLVELSQ
jgi:acetyl-CoA/propionyl-CoA carboxylase, biotin carboxylase, biotin carboxyl carrier protein